VNVEAWAADKTTADLVDLAEGPSQVLRPVAILCLRDRAQGGDDEAQAWLDRSWDHSWAREEAPTGQATSEQSRVVEGGEWFWRATGQATSNHAAEVEAEARLIYQGAVALFAAGCGGGVRKICVSEAAVLLDFAREEARDILGGRA